MTPVETWLSGGSPRGVRTMVGKMHRGNVLVRLLETGHDVAYGQGGSIEEAASDACNDLMRRAHADDLADADLERAHAERDLARARAR